MVQSAGSIGYGQQTRSEISPDKGNVKFNWWNSFWKNTDYGRHCDSSANNAVATTPSALRTHTVWSDCSGMIPVESQASFSRTMFTMFSNKKRTRCPLNLALLVDLHGGSSFKEFPCGLSDCSRRFAKQRMEPAWDNVQPEALFPDSFR